MKQQQLCIKGGMVFFAQEKNFQKKDILISDKRIVKIENDKLFASCAGMPPIYIYRSKTNSVEPIVLKGMPLGAFDNFEYKDIKVKLNHGDTILLFSDGLVELFNDKKEMYDYARIISTFERIGHNDAQQIIDDLVKEVDRWRNGNAPNDDVTFVILKVNNSK